MLRQVFAVVLLVAAALLIGTDTADVPAAPYPICLSPIFCTGPLLHTVQMAHLHNDSKTFVDMKLRHSPEETLDRFYDWQLAQPDPTTAQIQQFVDAHFEPEGSEFEPWTPADWRADPAFLRRIADPTYRQFARALHAKWPELGRRQTADVAANPQLYSVIPVPHAVIVPSERFREFYYWDSYWIVLGLLHGEMHATVRGMLGNFVSMVEQYGFVPNGGRVYYLGRSQPPLLIPMVKRYLDRTGDLAFVRAAIDALEQEFAYWLDAERTVVVRGHRLSRYRGRAAAARPEAYWEDVRAAEAAFGAADTPPAQRFFAEMQSAAESGWDFSSRWFGAVEQQNGNGTLVDTRCSRVVPVELNAVLQWNARTLAELHRRLGHFDRAGAFAAQAGRLQAAINAVLWRRDRGVWLDWDLDAGRHIDAFVPTNLAPLWTRSYDRGNVQQLSAQVVAYLRAEGVAGGGGFAGGVPATLRRTGEQWDAPNAWPPMQHMLVEGLAGLETRAAGEMAFELTERWVYGNWLAFNRTGAMFEKYSADVLGEGGDGGEYEVQLGFGWSNGVVLDLLAKYGGRLRLREAAAGGDE